MCKSTNNGAYGVAFKHITPPNKCPGHMLKLTCILHFCGRNSTVNLQCKRHSPGTIFMFNCPVFNQEVFIQWLQKDF